MHIKKHLLLRERLRPYITEQMEQAHKKGTPVMRPLRSGEFCVKTEYHYQYQKQS